MFYQSNEGQPWNRLKAYVRTPTGLHSTIAPVLLDTGTWYHVAMTYDGAILTLYVDGVPSAAVAAQGAVLPASEPLLFGVTYDEQYGSYFRGVLDEVYIYGRALGPNEVDQRIKKPGAKEKGVL